MVLNDSCSIIWRHTIFFNDLTPPIECIAAIHRIVLCQAFKGLDWHAIEILTALLIWCFRDWNFDIDSTWHILRGTTTAFGNWLQPLLVFLSSILLLNSEVLGDEFVRSYDCSLARCACRLISLIGGSCLLTSYRWVWWLLNFLQLTLESFCWTTMFKLWRQFKSLLIWLLLFERPFPLFLQLKLVKSVNAFLSLLAWLLILFQSAHVYWCLLSRWPLVIFLAVITAVWSSVIAICFPIRFSTDIERRLGDFEV